MPHWPARLEITRAALINSVRASVAVVASMLLARSLKLPEFYWAPISTIVILLSTIDPLTLAWQRFAGTALGAARTPQLPRRRDPDSGTRVRPQGRRGAARGPGSRPVAAVGSARRFNPAGARDPRCVVRHPEHIYVSADACLLYTSRCV